MSCEGCEKIQKARERRRWRGSLYETFKTFISDTFINEIKVKIVYSVVGARDIIRGKKGEGIPGKERNYCVWNISLHNGLLCGTSVDHIHTCIIPIQYIYI